MIRGLVVCIFLKISSHLIDETQGGRNREACAPPIFLDGGGGGGPGPTNK